MKFKTYITESEKNMKDAQTTLAGIPKKHAALIKGYKFNFQPDNTLKGDAQHVGVIDDSKKTITIAAPWNYGREFTLLHELGHLVWANLVPKEEQAKWHKLAKPYLKKLDDESEEVFCMIYASCYCKNKVSKFDIPKLEKFVKAVA